MAYDLKKRQEKASNNQIFNNRKVGVSYNSPNFKLALSHLAL